MMNIQKDRPKLPALDAAEYRDVISQLEAVGGGLVLATCHTQDGDMNFRVKIHGLEVRECVVVAQRLIANASKAAAPLAPLAKLLDDYIAAMGVGPINHAN